MWFPEHRNLLSKKFFYRNVSHGVQMKNIWFWNFFETSGGTKNWKNRKKCRFSAYFSIFFQVFRRFHARQSAKKLFLVKNASVLTPWWLIFRNPVGVPGCLFLLPRFYTGNFAFLSKKNFFLVPGKKFFYQKYWPCSELSFGILIDRFFNIGGV